MSTHHLGAILTITTDMFVCPSGMDGIYALLNDMTGDNLMTHQLPRVAEACRPVLLAKYPQLADIVVPDEFADEAHVRRWLAEQTDRHGTWFEVVPLAAEDHTVIDPIDEIRMMRPDLPVVAIQLPAQRDGGDDDA